MEKTAHAIFIFPMAIFLEYPVKKHTGLINMRILQGQLEKYWFRKNYSDEPTEDYIYIPPFILRTSTVESI